MRKSIIIYGSTIFLPDQPPESEIEGYGLPQEQQLWKRKELPSFFDTVDFDKEGNAVLDTEQRTYAKNEVERCRRGYWYFNNGHPTYITGKNYFYWQYWKLEDDIYPDARISDVNYFLFLDHWEKTLWCLFVARGKKRREGASSQATSNLIYECIFFTGSNCGLVSKSNIDSRDTFTDMAAFGYHQLPVFLKPRLLNRPDSVTELVFAAKVSNSNSKGNRSKINYRAPVENAYDRGRITRLLADECFAKGTKILCEDFIFRNIEEIKAGDKVMVEGGKLMEVGSVCNGVDDMYLIKQPYSKNYIVNKSHRLYLERRNDRKEDGIKITTVSDYLSLSKHKKRMTHGVRSSGIEFEETDVLIPPYIFGLWLGDGFSKFPRWVVNPNKDQEIISEIESYANQNNLRVNRGKTQTENAIRISVSNGNNRWKKSDFTNYLLELGVYNAKRIPISYFKNSRRVRLELLAGIIDTDGHKHKEGMVEIAMSRSGLIDDIALLARSLGFSVSKSATKITNFLTKAYRIHISGNLSSIPMRLPRKQYSNYVQAYQYRRNRIEVEGIGKGEYFGITLKADNDNDRRLILEDFTLSMNCGKWPLDVKASKFISKVSKTLIKGAKRVGFMEVPSTVNELTRGGGAEYKMIWDSANQFKTGGRKTPNRGVTYFTPAFENYEGFIDQYGESVVDAPTEEQYKFLVEKWVVKDPITDDTLSEISENDIKLGAKMYVYSRRNGLSGDLLEEEIRQNPCTVDEMFEAANTGCAFNSYLLNVRRKQIEEKSITPRKIIFERDLEGKVRPRDINKNEESFHWKLNWIPKPEKQNNFITDNGVRKPANVDECVITVDSYSNSQGGRKYGSKASAWLGRKFDINDPQNTGKAVGHLFGRPAVKETLHEQVMMAAEFFGCESFYEFTADDYLSYFRERGKVKYLGRFPINLIDPNQRKDADRYKGTPITPFSLTKQMDNGIAYVEFHSDKIDWIELIDNLKVFDPYNRTESDAVVSWLMLISCMMTPSVKPPPRRTPLVELVDNPYHGQTDAWV